MTDWLDEESAQFGVISLDHPEIEETAPLNHPKIQQFEEFVKKETERSSKKCWELEFYAPYFSVDTATVLGRVRTSLTPYGVFKDGRQPDLWCPFWAATTLVFLITAVASLSEVIWREGSWSSEASTLRTAATLVYSIVFLFPLALYCYLSHHGSRVTLVEMLSLYGYSFVAFIPCSVLCVVPKFWVRGLVMGLGGALGTSYLLRNLRGEAGSFGFNRLWLYVFAGLGHALFALYTTLYFLA